MATVVLRGADLALLTDPVGQRVTVPHLTAAPWEETWAGALVTFEGDALPTGFRGTSQTRSWQMTCVFASYEQQAVLDLLTLLRLAADAADSRLLLRTHIGAIGGLDDVTAVQIFGVQVQPMTGRVTTVTFTANAVMWPESEEA
jgi:hypothetical protein